MVLDTLNKFGHIANMLYLCAVIKRENLLKPYIYEME